MKGFVSGLGICALLVCCWLLLVSFRQGGIKGLNELGTPATVLTSNGWATIDGYVPPPTARPTKPPEPTTTPAPSATETPRPTATHLSIPTLRPAPTPQPTIAIVIAFAGGASPPRSEDGTVNPWFVLAVLLAVVLTLLNTYMILARKMKKGPPPSPNRPASFPIRYQGMKEPDPLSDPDGATPLAIEEYLRQVGIEDE